jgi:hypothetical protein
MAHRGLSPSESWMRADIHDGPEHKLYIEAEYIDAALTFVSPPTSSCDARPDHTSWHKLTVRLEDVLLLLLEVDRTSGVQSADGRF